MIHAAGADAVKFQTFVPELVAAAEAPKAAEPAKDAPKAAAAPDGAKK